MKTLRHIMLALTVHFCALEVFAQEQLKIFGTVTDEFDRPLVKIKISLKYIGSSESKARGEFFFVLPKDIISGMPVEFEVANDTLAIFAPSRGLWNVPQQPRSQPVLIKLLRKGDHRFLSKLGMKDLMNEIIQERAKKETRLQARVAQLEQQLAETPKDPLAEEAKRLGFSKEDLLAAIEKAKQQLQESDDPYEIGLAKLYDKHFGEAARLIEQAIQRSEKIIHEAEREKEELPEKYLNLGNARAGEHDLAGAVAAYQKAIALQPANGDAHLLLGIVQYTKGDYQAVMKNWKKALAVFRRQSSGETTAGEASAFGNLGVVFRVLGKPDSARVYHQAALKIAREIGHRQNEANQLGNLGEVFRDLGEPDSARIYLQAALKIAREIGYHKGEASILGNLGWVFRALGQPDSAHVYLQAALKIAREIGYRQGEASILGYLGLVFHDLGKPKSVEEYLQAALKIAREIGYRQGEASILGYLGVVFRGFWKLDSGRVYHQAALKIHREIGYRQGEASDLGNLGLVFRALGQPDSTRIYLQAALKIVREIGDRQGVATHLGNLGAVFRDLRKPDSARVYLQAALKIDREIGYRYGEATALANLGVLYKDSSEFEQARHCLKQCLKIYEEIKSPDQQWASARLDEINAQVSQKLLDIGDDQVRRGQLDSAKVYYNLALQDSRTHSYRKGEWSALDRLSFLFHELQFEFLEAFAIDQQRVQLASGSTSARADFAEKHFTTGRFAECEQRLAALLENSQVEPSTKAALRAIAVANLFALNKRKQVPIQLDTLQTTIASQPDTFKVGWTFNGTKHFISQNEKLAPYRPWLLQLFQALEIEEGREAILAALREVRKKFKTVTGKKE